MNRDSFINELLMRKKSAIIVEGSDDVTFYENLYNFESNLYTIISPQDRFARGKGGKGEVIKIIDYTFERCTYNQRRKIVAIVDADYNHITGQMRKRQNLFLTDAHDMEIQIIMSDAFRKFINSFYKLKSNKDIFDEVEKMREKIIEKAMQFDLLLFSIYKVITEFLNEGHNGFYKKLGKYSILKKKMGLINKYISIDRKNRKITIENSKIFKLLDSLASIGEIINQGKLDQIKNILKEKSYDSYQIVNGHNFIAVLCVLSLLNVFGMELKGLNHLNTEKLLMDYTELFYFCKDMESKLRNSYEVLHFKKSRLYKEILEYNNDYFIN